MFAGTEFAGEHGSRGDDKDQAVVRMVLYKARAQPNSESQSPLGDVGSPEGRRRSGCADCYV